MADVDSKVSAVASNVKNVAAEVANVAATLATTRSELAEGHRETTAVTTSLAERVGKNTDALAELRRRGERKVVEFDIRKSSSPETWTVADVRVELRKADVGRSKYDVILHFDDRSVERKDLTVYQPVPFLVGRDNARYELVVTSVERDRIRGFLSMPTDSTLAANQVTGS
jgi:predicted transcriptional regulator